MYGLRYGTVAPPTHSSSLKLRASMSVIASARTNAAGVSGTSFAPAAASCSPTHSGLVLRTLMISSASFSMRCSVLSALPATVRTSGSDTSSLTRFTSGMTEGRNGAA